MYLFFKKGPGPDGNPENQPVWELNRPLRLLGGPGPQRKPVSGPVRRPHDPNTVGPLTPARGGLDGGLHGLTGPLT